MPRAAMLHACACLSVMDPKGARRCAHFFVRYSSCLFSFCSVQCRGERREEVIPAEPDGRPAGRCSLDRLLPSPRIIWYLLIPPEEGRHCEGQGAVSCRKAAAARMRWRFGHVAAKPHTVERTARPVKRTPRRCEKGNRSPNMYNQNMYNTCIIKFRIAERVRPIRLVSQNSLCPGRVRHMRCKETTIRKTSSRPGRLMPTGCGVGLASVTAGEHSPQRWTKLPVLLVRCEPAR